MHIFRLPLALAIVGCLLLLGCGSDSTPAPTPTPSPAQATAPVSLTITNAPPAGVAVLSFEITITAAVLQPGNVSLISTPTKIEISRLETERAFLSTMKVPAGTYQSIELTFANPEVSIINNSGSAIGSCAVREVCELKPSLIQTTATYSGAPFPLTLAADSGVGLLVDFDLTNSIQSDLAIKPVVSITQLPVATGTTHMDDLDDVVVQVTAIDATNKQLTVREGGSSGQVLTVATDAQTEFDDFDEAGLPNEFSSVAVGQVLEVELTLTSSGALLAKEIELSEHEKEGELEGVIVSVDSASQFTIVVLDEEPDTPGVEVGNEIAITIATDAKFDIDEEDLTIPHELVFQSAADLLIGQSVQIRPVSPVTGSPLNTTTTRVRLHESRLTAKIQSINGAVITLNELPPLFTSSTPAVTSLQVQTSPQTEYIKVSGISGLNSGDTISISGLLFKTSGAPILLAEKVRKR